MSIGLEVLVEKVVPGGRGFARLPDGRPVLVAGAFPGERVRLCTVRDRGSFLEATAEIIEAAERVPPRCPVAVACGGCDWMALEPDAQRKNKLAIVREALVRTGGFRELPPIEFAPAGELWAYRNRIRVQIKAGRVGFFMARSHELVAPEMCLVSAPELQAALREVRRQVLGAATAFDVFGHVELRRSPSSERVSLCFRLRRGARVTRRTRRALAELAERFVVVVEGEGAASREQIDSAGEPRTPELERFELDGCYLLAAPGAFTQVNWPVNLALVGAVVAGARARGARTFADLYCGSGNFSLPLATAGLVGRGVEASAPSIAAARQAATEQGLDQVCFTVGDVAHAAAAWAAAGERFDLVVVDPPRAGAKDALAAIARLTGDALAMVSCDPVTLARDLRVLTELGMSVESVLAFDMFPQTHHIECLAWLGRRG